MEASGDTFTEWDDDRYSTGIERFDEQHKRLFGLLNDLHTAMDEGHSEEEIGDILRELERYTEYHFGDEEEFMQDCGYAMDCSDCFFDHREMHDQFAEKVSEFRQRHEDGDYVTMEVLMFVRDWLDAHIAARTEDQSYSNYYEEDVDDDYEYTPGQLKRNRLGSSDAQPAPPRTDELDDVDVTLGSEIREGRPLTIPDGPVAAWFESIVETHGDRTAALVPGYQTDTQHTFADLYERARLVAGGLLATDFAPGDRLAIQADSRYEWSVVDVACHLAGLVSVPIYPSFSDSQTIRIVENVGVDGIVTDGDASADVTAAVNAVVDIDDLPTAEPRVLPGFEAEDDDVATVVFDAAAGEDPTGRVLTNRNLLAAAASLEAGLPLDAGSTGTCSLPLAHVYQRATTYYLWATGSAVAYMDSEEFTGQLASVQPDVLVGVPRIYQQLYGALHDRIANLGWMKRKLAGRVATYGRDIVDGNRTPLKYSAAKRVVFGPLREEFGVGNLTYALSGASRLDDHLLHFFRGFGVPVSELHGPIEAASVGTLNPAEDFERGTLGIPMAGIELALSEEGEILIRGPSVMREYLGDERATQYAIRDGWYHTGDTGEFDADGKLRIEES